jgi:hypothetical protein
VNPGIAIDIWAGFRGQLRRDFWGVALLWLGLSVATAALTFGFSMAESSYKCIVGLLPGDLDRLYCVTAFERPGTLALEAMGPAPGCLSPAPGDGEYFALSMLSDMVDRKEMDGFFFVARGKTVEVMLDGADSGRELNAELVVYHGYAPVYAGDTAQVLAKVSEKGGVAVNWALSCHGGGVGTDDMVRVSPGSTFSIMAMVGSRTGYDPRPRVMIPARAFPYETGASEVTVYISGGASVHRLTASLSEAAAKVSNSVSVQAARGEDAYGRQIKQARTSSLITAGVAAVIAAVAYANAGIFTTLWVSERLRGLALRRAVGATPGTIAIYVMSDLTIIALSSLVAGYVAVWAIWALWFRTNGVPMVTWIGLVGTSLVMLLGTVILGAVQCRLANKTEPALLLRRTV